MYLLLSLYISLPLSLPFFLSPSIFLLIYFLHFPFFDFSFIFFSYLKWNLLPSDKLRLSTTSLLLLLMMVLVVVVRVLTLLVKTAIRKSRSFTLKMCIYLFVQVSLWHFHCVIKVGNLSQGWHEGSLFNSYHT